MINTPHSLHTLIRSSLNICYVFQRLLLWLVVKKMQPQPDICWVSQSEWWQYLGDSLTHLDHNVGFDKVTPHT
jgi:hypothetical protein